MGSLFKGLFKSDSIPEGLSTELHAILSEMERERKAFELLTVRAEGSAERFEKLTAPVARIEETIEGLQKQMGRFEELGPRIVAADERSEALSEAHRHTEAQLEAVTGDAARAHSELAEFTQSLSAALALKDRLTGFLELEGPFKGLRSEADDLAGQLRDLRGNFGSIREAHDQTIRSYTDASARLDTFEPRYREMQAGVGDAEQRVDDLEQTLEAVEQIVARIPDAKRELGTLKALGDDVTQKISAIEQQRESVDRAAAQAAHLSEMMREIDQETRKQQENEKFLNRVRGSLDELKTLHLDLMERSEAISERQHRVEEEDSAKREELLAVRDQLRAEVEKTVKRFEFESKGLDSVSERVVELRSALSDCESRFQTLDDPSRTIGEVHEQAERLASRLAAITTDVAELDDRAEKAVVLRKNVDGLETMIRGVTERIGDIEQPIVLTAVEEAERRIADVDAAVKSLEMRSDNIDALSERMRRASDELDQRQAAIDKAAEHLDRVVALRQEAAAAAMELEEQSKRLTSELATAGGRTNRLSELVEQLEKRSDNVRFSEKRLGRFEERLENWETAEDKLNRATEQLNERQRSVETLQAEVKRLFEVTERTVEDVRAIGNARQDITDHRPVLEEILRELEQVVDGADALDTKKRQIDQAEERLARADARLIDIKATLGAVNGQKAFLDQVIEKAGSLTFQAKQAETLIDTLRAERDVTERFRDAVSEADDEAEDLKAG